MPEATLQERTNVEDVVRYSRHCGWCTKEDDTAASYLSRGRLFTIRKTGNRRPSVQIYASDSSYEIKSKGNQNVSLESLLSTYPDLASEVNELLEPAIEAQKSRQIKIGASAHQAAHALRRLGEAFNEFNRVIEPIDLVDVLTIDVEAETASVSTIGGWSSTVRSGPTTANIDVIRSTNIELAEHMPGDSVALRYEHTVFTGTICSMSYSQYSDTLSLGIRLYGQA